MGLIPLILFDLWAHCGPTVNIPLENILIPKGCANDKCGFLRELTSKMRPFDDSSGLVDDKIASDFPGIRSDPGIADRLPDRDSLPFDLKCALQEYLKDSLLPDGCERIERPPYKPIFQSPITNEKYQQNIPHPLIAPNIQPQIVTTTVERIVTVTANYPGPVQQSAGTNQLPMAQYSPPLIYQRSLYNKQPAVAPRPMETSVMTIAQPVAKLQHPALQIPIQSQVQQQPMPKQPLIQPTQPQYQQAIPIQPTQPQYQQTIPIQPLIQQIQPPQAQYQPQQTMPIQQIQPPQAQYQPQQTMPLMQPMQQPFYRQGFNTTANPGYPQDAGIPMGSSSFYQSRPGNVSSAISQPNARHSGCVGNNSLGTLLAQCQKKRRKRRHKHRNTVMNC